MALDFRVALEGVADTAKTILIKDATGVYSSANPGGWGGANEPSGDIYRYIIQLSHLSLPEVYTQVQGSTNNPPIEFNQPSLAEIAAGHTVELDTYKLGISDYNKTFSDGVYDINVNVILSTSVSITGVSGNPFVTGTGLDALTGYDVIHAGGMVYTIDKTRSTNGGTVLWLVEELVSNISGVQVGYKANLKAVNTNGLETCLKQKAVSACGCGKKDNVLSVWVDFLNSSFAIADGDYAIANDLIISAGITCNKKCGC